MTMPGLGKTRNEWLDERKVVLDQLREAGIDCNWFMDSGGVKLKQNGSVQMSFSLREYTDDIHLKHKQVIVDVMTKRYGKIKTSIYNAIDSHRDEYRVICTISK